MIRAFPFLFFALLIAPTWASSRPLLEDAVQRWLGERDHWAFTQRAVEYQNGKPHERLERYDPSRPGNARWQLLAIDGQEPTDEQRAAWEKKKFKRKPRRFDSPLGEFFDFDHATVEHEDARAVRFAVPLRTDKSWLFPVDKVDVAVTVSKETGALEQLSANVREPFRVLLGIARITNGSVDLNFDDGDDTQPATARPSGTAQVSVSRFGERVDFTWSDFKRVTPAKTAGTADAGKPDARAVTRSP